MLDHIHIQNYRLFKDLKIDKLGQVNLIAGKNNTGKTALLEALRIIANGVNHRPQIFSQLINEIIEKRGDFNEGNDYSTYESLFNSLGKDITLNNIQIYEQELDGFFLHYKDDINKESYSLNSTKSAKNVYEPETIYIPLVFESEKDAKYWDSISLTPKEDYVIEIMRTADSRINKVRFDSGKAKVLLQGENYPRLLKNLGEGVNRLFTIALGLVNARDKIFLIDEFEVGLHHSVQNQLWDIIFKYAKEWNIQVFATTHSRDTVKSFTSIAQKEEYKDMANYFRLQKLRNSDDIVAVHYNEQNLKTAIEQDIETR